jgi:ABC-2 type transport system ATP-binding protein
MQDVIRIEGLAKAFRGVPVIHDISLSVPAGSVYAFLGPNGAGKTTTIRLALGLLRPDAGMVEILGRRLPEARRAILSRVGTMIDAPSLYPHLTAVENLEVTRRILDAPRSEIAVLTIGNG